MFSGLRSQCMRPKECMYASAMRHWCAMERIRDPEEEAGDMPEVGDLEADDAVRLKIDALHRA
eukprot:scaffold263834_cov35-Tisochrysis_lutea.AAC.2